MVLFSDWKEELSATQAAAEDLLQQVAATATPPNEHTLMRLDKLASACARLAYGSNAPSSLTEPVHNLIAWCDHLNEPGWRTKFIAALKSYPLSSPW